MLPQEQKEQIEDKTETKLESGNREKTKQDLKFFGIMFLVNSAIVWACVLFVERAPWFCIVILMLVVPIFGGTVRGIKSKSKHFLLITTIWAIVLAVGYVPLYGYVTDLTMEDYGFAIGAGLVTAGIMFVSSLIGLAIRKQSEKQEKNFSKLDKNTDKMV